MTRLKLTSLSLAATTTLLSAGMAQAVEVRFDFTNHAAADGLFFTPFVGVAHDGSFDTFNTGRFADQSQSLSERSLEDLAEEGIVSGVVADATAAGFQSGVALNADGFGGAPVLDPGETGSFTLDLDPTTDLFFSFLSMIIPSNDTFIGNGNPEAIELFNSEGEFVADLVELTTLNVYDAGTELDDGNGAAFAPPTGTDATETRTRIRRESNLDFLIGRPTAAGGTIGSVPGRGDLFASIQISLVENAPAPVPLPAAGMLLLGGLGALGFGRTIRSRRQKS